MYRPTITLFLAAAIPMVSSAADPNGSPESKGGNAKPSSVKLVDRHSLKVNYGRIILLRYKSEAIALKFTRSSDTADGGAMYRVWVNHRGPQRFREGRLTKIKGEVFEKMDNAHLHDRESDTYLRCGSFKLGWSRRGQDSGYLYFPDPKKSDLKIALTEWHRVKDINFTSDMLQWIAWDGSATDLDELGLFLDEL